MSDYDPILELGKLLEEADAKVTFSVNCRSGLVATRWCQCWRCRGLEPDQEAPEWAETAKLLGRAFNNGVAMGQQHKRERVTELRALCSWLAETVHIQQDSLYAEDCPPEVREWLVAKMPRVQGGLMNLAIERMRRGLTTDSDDLIQSAVAKWGQSS